MKLLIVLLILPLSDSMAVSLETLKQELLKENYDIAIMKNKVDIDSQNLIGNKAYLWPKLSINAAASTGKDKGDTLNSVSSDATAGPNGTSLLSNTTGSATNSVQVEKESWSADASISYVAFSRFSITSSIQSAENQFLSSQLDHAGIKSQQVVHLYQLLLEINALRDMAKTLTEADEIMEKVRIRKTKHKRLYNKGQALKFDKQYYELKYQKSRVEGALALALEALKDLIPSITTEQMQELPKIKIEFGLQDIEGLKRKFVDKSPTIKKLDLSINTYETYKDATAWERPWVPSIVLTTSYSQFGGFNGQETEDDYRASVLFTFDIFDGGRTSARRAQAITAHELAQRRKKSEIQKNIVHLTKVHGDAVNSRNEYFFKNAISLEKKHKLNQLDIVSRSGSSVDFERSMLRLDYVKSQYEAYNAQKKYQSSMLDLALKVDELDKVVVHEL